MTTDPGAWFDAGVLAPVLVVIAFHLAVVPLLPRSSTLARTAVALIASYWLARYMAWRIEETVLPFDGSALEVAWVWTVFAVELLALFEVAVFFLSVSRVARPLQPDADAVARLEGAKVDVFIPTYDEGFEVLEKSVIAAQAIDWPNFQVHVLDDGRRPWLADWCRARGVSYFTRPDNKHAKAGNMNAALARTDGDFVAVLDADFAAHANFLRETIPLFADEGIGIVQTPQHFFNRDPVQMNLGLAGDAADEQRLAFDHMQPGRDGWGAAFCCGSCSVLRRAALDEIGGVPTESVTEDILTTLAMLRHGRRTAYLNKRLSVGLAPESAEAYFVQRKRWCRGGIQTLYLRDGPFGPGLPLLTRLLFLPLYWLTSNGCRVFALSVPVVYLLFGLAPLALENPWQLMVWQVPALLSVLLSTCWIVQRTWIPVLNDGIATFTALQLFPTAVASILAPFGHPFRVTPKGRAVKPGFERTTLRAVLLALGLTLFGLAVNVVDVPGLGVHGSDAGSFLGVAIAWALFNVLLLLIAGLMCLDAPRPRGEERFHLDLAAALLPGGPDARGAPVPVVVRDLSLSGVRLAAAPGAALPEPGAAGLRLSIPGLAPELALIPVGPRGDEAVFALDGLSQDARAELIAFLFSGRFSTLPATPAPVRELLLRLLRRLVRGEARNPAGRAVRLRRTSDA